MLKFFRNKEKMKREKKKKTKRNEMKRNQMKKKSKKMITRKLYIFFESVCLFKNILSVFFFTELFCIDYYLMQITLLMQLYNIHFFGGASIRHRIETIVIKPCICVYGCWVHNIWYSIKLISIFKTKLWKLCDCWRGCDREKLVQLYSHMRL